MGGGMMGMGPGHGASGAGPGASGCPGMTGTGPAVAPAQITEEKAFAHLLQQSTVTEA